MDCDEIMGIQNRLSVSLREGVNWGMCGSGVSTELGHDSQPNGQSQDIKHFDNTQTNYN